jgi:small nuclear ribonucleoprotein (snRNP)-like protein
MAQRTIRSIFYLILILQLVAVIALPHANAQSNEDKPFWEKWRVFVLPVALLFLFATINYAIDLFRKDKILKKLLKKYVVFEMNGKRYRGTMRLESNGIEIISEESRQRGHAPSYIFRGPEREGIVAYIRYLDSMNGRERLERDWDFDRIYHPRLTTRLQRKIRNLGVALRSSINKTVEMIWGQIKKTTAFKPVSQAPQGEGVSPAGEIEAMRKELWEYAMEESYERLIERLVGTRVKVTTSKKEDYTAVLKEYTDKHIYLMDVKCAAVVPPANDQGYKLGGGYKDEWDVTLNIEHGKINVRDERGLRSKIEGDDLVLENNTPYEIQLWGLTYEVPGKETDAHDWKWGYHIPPFSVQKIHLQPRPKHHNVGPFQRVVVQEPRTYRAFKLLKLKFRSFRDADIVFTRACKIIESAEKYERESLDFGGLTAALLASQEVEDVAITDESGESIHGLNVIRGYITNINEDRIDVKEIDYCYDKRWSVEGAFGRFDEKLRKVGPPHVRILPPYRTRMAAQTMLVEEIGESRGNREILSPFLFTPVSSRRKPYKKPEHPLKVMALTGNVTEAEFPALQQLENVNEHHIIYEPVKDLRTAYMAKAHILWIGHGEIYKEGYRLSIDAEHRIKNFVGRGGIAIVSGQDISNMQRRRQSVGWVPEPLIGVEYDETQEFTPTRAGKRGKIFHYPHKIKSGEIKLDDMWIDQLNKYTSLAKANRGDEDAILLLPYQAGLYIVTSLKNETETDVQINHAIMANLLHFSVKFIDKQKHSHLYYVAQGA